MKRIVISTAVLALACAGLGQASAAPAVYKVTGGGQITTADQRGAGSTVAFSAQSQGEEGSAAKGQIQLQLRDAAAGTKETVHATVDCVVVFAVEDGMPAMAAVGGTTRDGRDIRIDVTDDGQGADTMDMVSVRFDMDARDGGDDDEGDTSLCDEEDENAESMLGRGNVKIHKAKAAPAGGSTQGRGGKGGSAL